MMEKNPLADDAALVEAALKEGGAAFAPIIERYKNAVFGVALARLGHFHDAEDITQQVFIDAFERLGRLRAPERLGAWLRSMAVHRSIDLVRQKSHTLELDAVPEPLSTSPTPQAELERRELHAQVEKALNKLSRPQRETIALFYLGGYGRREIAAIQDVSEDAIKSRLRTAKARLKKDMIGMVEEVLKDAAPKKDFAERVYKLLNIYPTGRQNWWRWQETIEELQRIGIPGIEGFIRAFALPHARTRLRTVRAVRAVESALRDPTEATIDLLLQGLRDSHKKVRGTAANTLMCLDVSRERKRREFMPLVVDMMLNDPCPNVRRTITHKATWLFGECIADFPATQIAVAMGREKDPKILMHMQNLIRRIAMERDKER